MRPISVANFGCHHLLLNMFVICDFLHWNCFYSWILWPVSFPFQRHFVFFLRHFVGWFFIWRDFRWKCNEIHCYVITLRSKNCIKFYPWDSACNLYLVDLRIPTEIIYKFHIKIRIIACFSIYVWVRVVCWLLWDFVGCRTHRAHHHHSFLERKWWKIAIP